MTNKINSCIVETFAFSAFRNSYEEIKCYCFLTQSTNSAPWSLDDIEQIKFVKDQEKKPAQFAQLLPIFKTGHSIAIKLSIVYLAAVVEAYAKDVLVELTDRRIRKLNHILMGSPIPKSEDEDIIIDIELEDAEKDSSSQFYIFAEKTRDFIKEKINHNTVITSLKLLKSLYGIEIQEKDKHLLRWENIKKLRNNIVHHRGYSKEKFTFTTIKGVNNTRNDISVSSDHVKQALDDMFNFVYSIELSIFNSIHNKR